MCIDKRLHHLPQRPSLKRPERTETVRFWYGDDDGIAEVMVAIRYLPRTSDPDDGPEWGIRSAVDRDTREAIVLTDEEETYAFNIAAGYERQPVL